ncbi:MAG: hypothetical protein U0401_18005 [Anaerolineae bacterium]
MATTRTSLNLEFFAQVFLAVSTDWERRMVSITSSELAKATRSPFQNMGALLGLLQLVTAAAGDDGLAVLDEKLQGLFERQQARSPSTKAKGLLIIRGKPVAASA